MKRADRRAGRPAPDLPALAAYLARRKLARRLYAFTLVALFTGAFACVATGTYGNLPHFVVVAGIAVLTVAVACEAYLHRSLCPRCGNRFAENSFILQSVALLTARYRACQSCGLSEEELAGEPVIDP
jgi:hypothetical protein